MQESTKYLLFEGITNSAEAPLMAGAADDQLLLYGFDIPSQHIAKAPNKQANTLLHSLSLGSFACRSDSPGTA